MTTTTDEIVLCEVANTEINIQHHYPVSKDLEIMLPLKLEKMQEIQLSNRYNKHLRSQWEKNNLDRNMYTMDNGLLKRKLISNGLLYKPVIVLDIQTFPIDPSP